MECDICCESFDHSIRKPYSLSSCPHTFCLKCLEEYSKECPECRRPINGKNINIALLKLIPESSYDKIKSNYIEILY
jgi:hypothetical protein